MSLAEEQERLPCEWMETNWMVVAYMALAITAEGQGTLTEPQFCHPLCEAGSTSDLQERQAF